MLSDDLRRSLADPKVTIPDRYFVLSLDFAQTDFQQPIHLKKPAPNGPLRSTKRANRPAGDTDPGLNQTMP